MKEQKGKSGFRGVTLLLLLALVTSLCSQATAKAALSKPSVSLTKRTKTSATIKIAKQGSMSGYQIFFKASKKEKFRQIMGIREQSYTIKGLKQKKTYYVKVRAFRTKGYQITTGKFSKVIKIGPYKKKTNTNTTPAPEVTPVPDVTPAPEVTPTPEVTSVPEATPLSEVTPAPEVSQAQESEQDLALSKESV